MRYAIKGIDAQHECDLVGGSSLGEFMININGKKNTIRVLSVDSSGINFILNNSHHHVTYLKGGALETRMILDGHDMSVMRHTGLDEIVYKNSGGKSDAGASKDALLSPIPGKVITVAVSEGASVKKDDQICVLEAMKMQVSVKAHKDGTIKILNVNPDSVIAKGFIVAEIS